MTSCPTLDLEDVVLDDFRRLFARSDALVVEDEVGAIVVASLRQAGFNRVDLAGTRDAAVAALVGHAYDVVILDRRLPDGDGMELLARIRTGSGFATPSDVAVLVFSMLDAGGEPLRGLIAGADDYVSKAASSEELIARIAVRYRVKGRAGVQGWSAGPLEIDERARVVALQGEGLKLTSREAHILCELHAERGRPLSKSMLWERCWIGSGWTHFPDQYENIVDQAIRRLRQRLEAQCKGIPDAYHPLVANIWAKGFALRDLSGLTSS